MNDADRKQMALILDCIRRKRRGEPAPKFEALDYGDHPMLKLIRKDETIK